MAPWSGFFNRTCARCEPCERGRASVRDRIAIRHSRGLGTGRPRQALKRNLDPGPAQYVPRVVGALATGDAIVDLPKHGSHARHRLIYQTTLMELAIARSDVSIKCRDSEKSR